MAVHEDPRPEPAAAQAASYDVGSDWLDRALRLLYTHNPFYLLSVAFVLHSTRLWLNTRAWPYDPWPLMYIIGGYILLIALVGGLVVRLGKAWDDARSILLILLLLFVELSLTFDPVLVADPRLGLTLLVTGWLLAVVVSEGLFWGLRIRLGSFFRVPYHLLLGLLFLYPPLIVVGLRTETVSAIWRIWAFSPIAGLSLLTLIPAIRRGPDYVRENGTPWRWPIFPWALFVFLGLCLGVRSYALTLSFDSVLMQNLQQAMRLQSAFSPFFLNPLVLAVGVLVLEAGLVSGSRRLQRIALLAPVLACLLANWFPNSSLPAEDFLHRFIDRLGSPLWIAAWCGLVFFAYARFRRVLDASWGIAGLVLLLGAVGPRTVDWPTMRWQVWPVWIATIVLGIQGLRRRSAAELFAAGVAAAVAARFDWLGHMEWPLQLGIPLQLLSIWAVVLGILFKDVWARGLRALGLAGLITGCVVAAAWPEALPGGLPAWTRPAYLVAVIGGTLICAYLIGSRAYLFAGIGMLLVSMGRVLHACSVELERAAQWKGAGFFVLGLVWLGLAVSISSAKAGLGKVLLRRIAPPTGDAEPPNGSGGT